MARAHVTAEIASLALSSGVERHLAWPPFWTFPCRRRTLTALAGQEREPALGLHPTWPSGLFGFT
jgi:hypothetical protein